VIAKGDDLGVIFNTLKAQHASALQAEHPLVQHGITKDFLDLPLCVPVQEGALTFTYYPALVDKQESVSIALFETQAQAQKSHSMGIARLALLQLTALISQCKKSLSTQDKKMLSQNDLINTLFLATAKALWEENAWALRTQAAFAQAIAQKRGQFLAKANSLILLVTKIKALQAKVAAQLAALQSKSANNPSWKPAIDDMQKQLTRLLSEDFLITTPWVWLSRYGVYLEVILQRAEKLPRQVARDQQLQAEVLAVEKAYYRLLSQKSGKVEEGLIDFFWKIQEFRISLFAQSLKTVMPVSKVRLLRELAERED